MSVNNINNIYAVQQSAISSPHETAQAADDKNRPLSNTEKRLYFGEGGDTREINDILFNPAYFRNADNNFIAVDVLRRAMALIRNGHPESKLIASDMEAAFIKLINSPIFNKPSYEARYKAALEIAALYGEYHKDDAKALSILALLCGKDGAGAFELTSHLDGTKASTNDIFASYGEEKGEVSPEYKMLALAKYYDTKIKLEKISANKDPHKVIEQGIRELKQSILDAKKSPNRIGWALVQSYSILAKLLAATKDPRLEAEAVKITEMLRSASDSKEPITLMINGKAVEMPWVNASDGGAKYFRTSAANTELQLLGEKENLSPAESARAMALAEEILASGSMADSYMTAATRRIKADLLMRLDIRDEAKKEAVLRQAKALYTDALYSGSDDSYLIAKSAAGLAQIALVLDKDPERAFALASAVLGEGSSRVEAVPGRAVTVPPIKNDPNTFAMTRIVKIEAEIMLLQDTLTEIFRTNRDRPTREIEGLDAYRQAADTLLDIKKEARASLSSIANSNDPKISGFTKTLASLTMAKIYLLSDELRSMEGSGPKEDARLAYSLLSGLTRPDADTHEYIRTNAQAKLAQAHLSLHAETSGIEQDGSFLRSAAAECEQILAGDGYADVKREAALTLGGIYQAQKAPEKAASVFAALRNGGTVNIGGRQVEIPKIKDNDAYNLAKISLGTAESLMAVTPRDYAEKRALMEESLEKAGEAAGKAVDSATSDGSSLLRAEALAHKSPTREESKQAFESVLGTPHKINNARARLGLVIIGLDDKNPDKDIRGSLPELLNLIEEYGSDPDLRFIRQRAVIELANYLSRFEASKPAALALLDRLIDGARAQAADPAEMLSALTKEYDRPIAERQVLIDIINADPGRIGRIISSAQKLPDDEYYLLASARMQRAELFYSQNLPEYTQKAYADAAEVERLCSIDPNSDNRPYVFAPLIRLQTQASELLAQIRSFDISPARAEQGIIRLIEDNLEALDEGEAEDYSDSFAYLKLEELNRQVAQWNPRKRVTDRGVTGEIIARYQYIVDNPGFSPVVRYAAQTGLINAYNKFGMEKEAKQLTEQMAKAPDEYIPAHISADVLSKLGVYEIGNSRFRIASQYFMEAQKRDANNIDAVIYEARARYLTEEFEPGKLAFMTGKDTEDKRFVQAYNDALQKIWETIPLALGERPDTATLAKDFLEETGAFSEISSSAQGRQFILTALEADAKNCFDKGKTLDAMKRLQKALALMDYWERNGLEVKADYLFEMQIHYDLASCYMARGLHRDAYNHYLYIYENGVERGVVPGWWVEEQLRVLSPEKFKVEKTSGSVSGTSVSWDATFDWGSAGLVASKDGARAEGLIFLDGDKKQSVRVYLGAYKNDSYTAGANYEIDLNRVKLSAGIDYQTSRAGGTTTSSITGKVGAEVRLNRHTKAGIYGKATHQTGIGPSFTTYEVGAYLDYSRRIGRDTTLFANLSVLYSTRRVGLKETGWTDTFQASPGFESGWRWEESSHGPVSFTEDSKSGTRLRSRTWHVVDTYNQHSNLELQHYYVRNALEAQKVTKTVLTGDVLNPIDISLNNVYFYDIMGAGSLPVNAANCIEVPKGVRPSASEIESIPIKAMSSEGLLMHEEEIKTTSATNPNSIFVTVKARDRNPAPFGEIPTEANTTMGPWYDLYTIAVVKSPTRTVVTMLDHLTQCVRLLYTGESTEQIDYKMVGTLMQRATAGITKRKYLESLKAVAELTVSGTIQNESTKEVKTVNTPNGSKQVLENSNTTTVGVQIEGAISKGSGRLAAGLGVSYDGKNVYDNSRISYTQSVGNASLTGAASTSGLQGEMTWGPLSVGGSTRGAHVSISTPPLKADINGDGLPDQLLGPLQLGVNQSGNPSAAGIAFPISAATGWSLLFSSIAMARNAERGQAAVSGQFDRTRQDYYGLADGHNMWLDSSKLFPAYAEYEEELSDIFVDVHADVLIFRPNITRSAIPELLPEDAPEELIDILQNYYEVRTAASLRRELDDLHIRRGAYQSNVGANLPRIFAANLLTIIFGSRETRNSNEVEKEVRELADIIDTFASTDGKTFGFLESGYLDASDDNIRDAIALYVESDPNDLEETDGLFRKIADIQAKGGKVLFSPFMAIGRGVGIFKPKTKAGTVVKRSFSQTGVKRDMVWETLSEKGYIDESGVIQPSFRRLRKASDMDLPAEHFTVTAAQKIFDVMKESLSRENTAQKEWQAPDISTDEKLREAFERRLLEDTLYLILRIYAQSGTSHQTRGQISALLAKLPESIKAEATNFIKAIPVEHAAEAAIPSRISLPPSERPETPEETRAGGKPVKMTPQVIAQMSLDGENLREYVELGSQAVEELKGIERKQAISAIADSISAFIPSGTEVPVGQDLDGDNINDDLYKELLKLFMIAGSSAESAGLVSDALVLSEEQRAYIRNGAVTKSMLAQAGLDTELAWEALIQKGYIYPNGAISSRVSKITDRRDLLLADTGLADSAEQIFALIKDIRGIEHKIEDFYVSRRPKATGVFGKVKREVKVTGMWGRDNGSGVPAPLKGAFDIRDFISYVIEGRVKDMTIEQNLRTISPKDLEKTGIKGEPLEALWTDLINRGYINQNGYVQPKTMAITSLEGFEIPEQFSEHKADIFERLTGAKAKQPAFIRDGSSRVRTNYTGRTPAVLAEETARRSLDIQPAQAPAAEPEVVEAEEAALLAMPAKKEEPPAAKTAENDKEAEKAARAARIKAAQQRYGVGTNRSRRR